MKIILVLTALMSGAGIAIPQIQSPPKPPTVPSQSFRAVDKNRDGKVDGIERKAAHGAEMATRMYELELMFLQALGCTRQGNFMVRP